MNIICNQSQDHHQRAYRYLIKIPSVWGVKYFCIYPKHTWTTPHFPMWISEWLFVWTGVRGKNAKRKFFARAAENRPKNAQILKNFGFFFVFCGFWNLFPCLFAVTVFFVCRGINPPFKLFSISSFFSYTNNSIFFIAAWLLLCWELVDNPFCPSSLPSFFFFLLPLSHLGAEAPPGCGEKWVTIMRIINGEYRIDMFIVVYAKKIRV